MTAPHELLTPPAPSPTLPPVPVPVPVPGPGPAPASGRPRYSVGLAEDEAGVRAAQRLRHQVFAGETGAVLDTPVPGLDIDPLDAYCDHLLVRDESTGAVVGTYRLLSPRTPAGPAGSTPTPSSTSAGWPGSATTWSRWAVPACTPPTATAPWSR